MATSSFIARAATATLTQSPNRNTRRVGPPRGSVRSRPAPRARTSTPLLPMGPSTRSSLATAAAAAEGATINWEPSEEVLATWKAADVVAFDVDSTFCQDESIDEVAAFLGCGEQVAELTSRAMGGTVLFQDALAARLDVMQVSASAMESYLASHPPLISPGIPELVRELQAQGKAVYLVSGGFRQIIGPVADKVGIPRSNIFANNILYNEDGSYAGFDREEFTSRSGGKPAALRKIMEDGGYKVAVMVGDGATDMEARREGVAALFIGYGGVVQRDNVAAAADWYVKDFDGMLNALRC